MKNSNFLRIYTEIVNEKLPENNLECILNALWPAGRDFDNSLKLESVFPAVVFYTVIMVAKISEKTMQ